MDDLNLVLTTAGEALMAKINLGNGTIPLEITRVVTSADNSGDPLNMDVGEITIAQEFIITGRQRIGARAIISTYLNNFGNPSATPPVPALAVGYTLSRVWFFANDPDDGEIPLRVSQFSQPNYVPAATERSWEYSPTWNFTTGNASTVIINIDPASSVTKQDVWNAVDISSDEPADMGIKTQYFIESDVPGYQPVQLAPIYFLQGTFDPATGDDGDGDPIVALTSDDAGSYWTASAPGTFTPPGNLTPLTFAVGDWLLWNGMTFTQTPPISTAPGSGLFAGAKMVEVRVIADPSNPTGSVFQVALPITILAAVINPDTGESLINLLAHSEGALAGHIGNGDVHVTALWKSIIDQTVADLITFSQRTDIFVTPMQVAAWNAAIITANNALALSQSNAGHLADIDGRISLIEDSLFNGITTNPFLISFDNLTGIVLTYGVWNTIFNRIEC